MDIHINKKTAGLMLASLIVGGVLGGVVGGVAGFAASGHEGHGYEMGGQNDNHADGEMNDDNGGAPNSDEQQATTQAGSVKTIVSTTTVQTQ